MSKKGTPRKKPADFNDEHETFLELVRGKKPELEIMKIMGLSQVQMNAHTLKALQKDKIPASEMIPDYEVVSIKSLPAVLREYLSATSDADVETLVKAGVLAKLEIHEAGILLTLLPVVPRPFATETESQDAGGEEAEAAADDTCEEAKIV